MNVRKKYARKGSKPVKRRYTKKGKTNITKIVNNILTKRLEKKRTDITYAVTDATMGQVSGSANGYYSSEVTPSPSVGTQLNQRIGNEISLTGLYMTLQLRQMSATVSPAKLTFYLMRMKGDYSSTAAQLVGNSFNANEYVGGGGIIYDTQSSFNPDFITSFTVLKKFNVYMKPDSFTGQQMPMTKTVGLKFKKPLNIRYFGSSGTTASQGKMFLVGFASSGNASTTNVCLLSNVPVTPINTGVFLNYNIKYYYTDA